MELQGKSYISGSVLKLLAMSFMFIDHFAFFIMKEISFCTTPLFTISGLGFSLYSLCRLIGRISFPLYCFLLTEGFIHTKNRRKYGIRLLAFALISEVPWNFIRSGTLFYPSQNVMFTLLFGYLALGVIEEFSKDYIKQILLLVPLFIICSFGRFDYGAQGLSLILVMYFLRNNPAVQAIVGSSLLRLGWAAIFAFIPINLYNHKRGFMKGTFTKYIGYIFYPAHLLLLGILRYYLFVI